jgi:hypothetical protein
MPRATLIAGIVLGAPGAFAATSRSFTLDASPCPAYDAVGLRALVDIELGTIAAERIPRPVAIRLDCDGESVRITVTDVGTGKQDRSVIAPREDAAAARVRLLALTITELVASAWNHPSPPSVPPAAAQEFSLPGPAPPPAAPRAWRLFADASLRRLGSPPAWRWGVAGGGERTLLRHFTLSLAVFGDTGTVSTSLADVNERDLGAAAAVRAGFSLGRLRLEAGPGFRAGLVRLSARPKLAGAQGGSLYGFSSGPLLSLRLATNLGRYASVEARLESGHATHKTTGLVNDTDRLADTGGWWFGFALGAGLEIL